MNPNKHISVTLLALGVTWPTLLLPAGSLAAPFTLTREALMLLDYSDPDDATVSGKTLTPTGVLFDVQYRSNRFAGSTLHFWSSASHGEGSLAGMDVTAYDGFGLRFTLVSVDGQSVPTVAGPLVIGSLIDGTTSAYRYRPEVIGLEGFFPASALSLTTHDPMIIDQIGFVANIPYWWWTLAANPWPHAGAHVQLLVEPMAGATALPEPNTVGLLVMGVAVMLRFGRWSRRRQ